MTRNEKIFQLHSQGTDVYDIAESFHLAPGTIKGICYQMRGGKLGTFRKIIQACYVVEHFHKLDYSMRRISDITALSPYYVKKCIKILRTGDFGKYEAIPELPKIWASNVLDSVGEYFCVRHQYGASCRDLAAQTSLSPHRIRNILKIMGCYKRNRPGKTFSLSMRSFDIVKVRRKGQTFQEIADYYGITRQAVFSIYQRDKLRLT